MAVGSCTLIDCLLPLDAGSATSLTPWSLANFACARDSFR
jgi:hypothetical protein